MAISFQNSFTQKAAINTTSYRQGSLTPAQKMQSAKSDVAKNMRMSEITAGTEPYKDENDRFLHKAQFAQTKVEAFGEYLGAMQTAVRDSGSKGIMAAKRVGNLIDTEEAFEQSAIYNRKKDKDTFLADQLAALEKRQEEIEEEKAYAEEKERRTAGYDKDDVDTRSVSEANALRSNSNRVVDTNGTVNKTVSDTQKAATKMYKVNDDPKKKAPSDIFTGMI